MARLVLTEIGSLSSAVSELFLDQYTTSLFRSVSYFNDAHSTNYNICFRQKLGRISTYYTEKYDLLVLVMVNHVTELRFA